MEDFSNLCEQFDDCNEKMRGGLGTRAGVHAFALNPKCTEHGVTSSLLISLLTDPKTLEKQKFTTIVLTNDLVIEISEFRKQSDQVPWPHGFGWKRDLWEST